MERSLHGQISSWKGLFMERSPMERSLHEKVPSGKSLYMERSLHGKVSSGKGLYMERYTLTFFFHVDRQTLFESEISSLC